MHGHMRTGFICAALLVVGAGACSSPPGGAPDAGHTDGGASSAEAATGDGAATCVTLNYHVDTFEVGMKKSGTGGLFTFELASADPLPPNDPQMNTWTIKVLDQTGAMVTDATVTLPSGNLQWMNPKNPWMPTMHHGSSIANTITNNGDGSATLQIYFSMSGLWQTYVVAQSGQMTDAAMFSFCLP